MKQCTLFFVVLFFALSSCKKVEYVDPLPRLSFTIIDEAGDLVEGAEIKLYTTYEDWFDIINPIDSANTDVNGHYVFNDLQEVYYFFDVEKGENMSNSGNNSSIESPLKKGVITNITVILKKYDY